ncbi:hypothetical protein TNCT_594091 [Trichonephila clavata]|uniref:DUF5641 domain-containing protein n=1 Tax=Trichonephila clavata TaxID=2740835 RepID=A0A8X6GGP0_TRICU|nr:hypothetical protein TNCT_594091 [Trichonephila clavata]
MNKLSRWQLVQRMNQHFWCKWSSEYLNRLQQRPNWCKGNVGFKGDLVLVKPSENSDTLKWHLVWILKLHRVPSGPPPDPEFPHFSNVPSGTAGGFFKARQRGNPHNVLPGTVQGRSQGGFLDMNESPSPSHPLPSPQPLGRFRHNVPQIRRQRRTQLFRRIPYPRKGPFHCPNSIPRGRGYRVVLRPLRAKG